MKQWNNLRLQRRLQVNQQVAAGDQVEAREWRVANNAVGREDAHIAQFLDYAISPGLMNKEAAKSLPLPRLPDNVPPARRPSPSHRCRWRRPGLLAAIAIFRHARATILLSNKPLLR